MGTAGTGVLAILSMVCLFQAEYWKSDEVFFRRQVEMQPDNWMAHNLLAVSLVRKGNVGSPLESSDVFPGKGFLAEALNHARRSVFLKPDFEDSRFNLALMYEIQGSFDQALREYDFLLRIAPDHQEARIRREIALYTLNQKDGEKRKFSMDLIPARVGPGKRGGDSAGGSAAQSAGREGGRGLPGSRDRGR